MAQVYVAGKDLERAEEVMSMLRRSGHCITYDWVTDYSEEDPLTKAASERSGVQQADILIYLWEPDQESARYEAGMAMGRNIPIIVSGGPEAFFFGLPEVQCVSNDSEIAHSMDTLTKELHGA